LESREDSKEEPTLEIPFSIFHHAFIGLATPKGFPGYTPPVRLSPKIPVFIPERLRAKIVTLTGW